jgi:CRISPR-associated protein Cas2
MTVIVLERVPASVRGELTRWMLEPKTGVFVGRLSALVRDKLWELICAKLTGRAAALMIHQSDTEQGYALRSAGATSRTVIDFDGLALVRIP